MTRQRRRPTYRQSEVRRLVMGGQIGSTPQGLMRMWPGLGRPGAGAQRQAIPVAMRALRLSTAGILGVGAALGVAVLALGLEPKREAVLSAAGVSDLYHEARKTVREEIGGSTDPPRPP